MLNFFYDSLETVQKLKFPTKQEYIRMGLAVFVAIIIAGVYFMISDTVISQLYSTLYQLLRG
ncbi:MAG TPA: preprotein translocase subunit SecE [Candidatus Absconditabacterales bacterium]|nr:preprotein translocase subunit SecE [Candidatus Absconditabacterales bacterium]HNG96804.1 preprotein translocase subunit SecE [Candidatus Absconditabacterales bacterium]